MNDYCCKAMKEIIENPDSVIIYEPYTRSYLLQYHANDNVTIIRCLSYCPWCGDKFPDNLYDEWSAEIEKILGVSVLPKTQFDQIPKELRTDEWWKKRGL